MNTKTNIQANIQNLFSLYQTAAAINTGLTSNAFDSVLSTLQSDFTNNQLTAEELAVANVTIERIEMQNSLKDKMYFVRRTLEAQLGRGIKTPDWLLLQGTDDIAFSDFFTNLVSLDSELRQIIERDMIIDVVLQNYESWKELRTKETLNVQAIEKVRMLIDLRRVLIAIIAYKGVSVEDVKNEMNI